MSHLKTAYALGQQYAIADFEAELQKRAAQDYFTPSAAGVSRLQSGGGGAAAKPSAERMNFDRGSTVTAQPPRTERMSFNQGSTVTAQPPASPFRPSEEGRARAMTGFDPMVVSRSQPKPQPRLARIQGMPKTDASGMVPSGDLPISRKAPPASALAMRGGAAGAMPGNAPVATNQGDMLASLGL